METNVKSDLEVIEFFKKEKMNDFLPRYREAERLRREFVHDFPLSRIAELSLYEYLIAKSGYGNPYSFCRRLRYEQENWCHMGNVWPSVFGIYLKNGTELTMSPSFERISDGDAQIAFRIIIKEIVVLISAGEREDYDAIARCNLNSSFKYKLLAVYFPDKYIPVCAKETLDAYCEAVGILFNKGEEPIYRNVALRKWKEEVPEMADWTNIQLMFFCDWLWRQNKKIDGSSLKGISFSSKAIKIEKELDMLQLEGETGEAVVRVRVNQGVFRDRLLHRYNSCCLCGVSNPDLLIASHIKPWRDSMPEEKLDIDNGFLMCPNHDRLFDQGWITFDEQGNIQISDHLDMRDRILTNIQPTMKIDLTDGNREYLKYHRKNIYK